MKSPFRDDSPGIAVSPSLYPALVLTRVRSLIDRFDRHILKVSGLAIVLGLVAPVIATTLVSLIQFFTNLFFYGTLSWKPASPAGNQLGAWVIAIPVVGGIVVGLIARFGSKAIRGHGIPEAMEQILVNESRIPFRMTFLKPLSAAISIGSGGPFGAEGPIIATGGALGSLVGQVVHTTPLQRKTLLAAGAAAGMTAIFGSPVSAVLLAVELLLFEYHANSLIPVALAAATAAAVRLVLVGNLAAFQMPELAAFQGSSLPFYLFEGAFIGLASVLVTKLVYRIEDSFEHLSLHWMWWPALGGVAVGIIGYVDSRTLGVGYDNIEHILAGKLVGWGLVSFCALKLLSWAISLGSGTSGGTLAPLLTIGGGMGFALATVTQHAWPALPIDPSLAALVGMAALFAGASRALLTSVLFAFEATHQSAALVPLLAGCGLSHLISYFLMRNTIMTEKISRRGVTVPDEYRPETLKHVRAKERANANVQKLQATLTVADVLAVLKAEPTHYTHSEYPVVDESGSIVGMVHLRTVLAASATPAVRLSQLALRLPTWISEKTSLQEALEIMQSEAASCSLLFDPLHEGAMTGILTHRDILGKSDSVR